MADAEAVASVRSGRRGAVGQPAPALTIALVGLVLLGLALKLELVFGLNVNWDEFNYLSRLFAHRRGELAEPLQNLHVHLFAWLPWVGETGIDQVLAARGVLFGLRLGSCLCIYWIGRRLYGHVGALFATLCSFSFSFVLAHGESFRYDPLLSFCFLAASALLLLRPRSRIADTGAGVVLGASILVSLKMILLAPAILGLVALRFGGRAGCRDALRGGLACGLAFFGTAAAIYGFRWWVSGSGEVPRDTAFVASAGRLVFSEGWVPQWRFLEQSLRYDWAWWALWVSGLGLTLRDAWRRSGEPRRDGLALLAFSSPVLALLFYRNAFPYFYATIVPAASLLCGVIVSRAMERLSDRPGGATAAVLLLALPVSATGIRFCLENRGDQIAPQRRLVAAVRELFPEPVPYIERTAMLPRYPKAGPFMTSWTMREYRLAGKPIMADILRRERPQFLIANVPALDLSLSEGRGVHRLLPADFRVLKTSFVHHWGPLWVPGMRLHPTAGAPAAFHVRIEGVYTVSVSGGGGATIDGRGVEDGAAVWLGEGPHVAAARAAPPSGGITLRWGDHLPVPQEPPHPDPIFRGFRFGR